MIVQNRIALNYFIFHLTLDNLLSAETLLAINNEAHFAIPNRSKYVIYDDVFQFLQWTDPNLLHTPLLKLVIEFFKRDVHAADSLSNKRQEPLEIAVN